MRELLVRLVTAAIAVTVLSGCAAKARERPLPTTKIDSGPQTVENVRRQLQGTWTLERFEIMESGVQRVVHAKGQLTYDAFGNLRVEGIPLDPADAAAASGGAHPLLNYTGRVVIDPDRQELRLEDAQADAPVSDLARRVLALFEYAPREVAHQARQLCIFQAEFLPVGIEYSDAARVVEQRMRAAGCGRVG